MRLDSFTSHHFPLLMQWVDNADDLVQFAGPSFSYPLTDEQLKAYASNPDRHIFVVIAEGQEIGVGEIFRAAPGVRRLCRIILAKAFRGKGYGKQMIRALLEVAFADPEVVLVNLNVYDFNVGAIRCYEQCGFVFVPEWREVVVVNGKEWVTLQMALDHSLYNASL